MHSSMDYSVFYVYKLMNVTSGICIIKTKLALRNSIHEQ